MDADNLLGDLTVTDPKAMRALSHPVRLAILDLLRRDGPASATELAKEIDASPSTISWHLRHLAGFGLVRDSEGGSDRRYRRWEVVARGFRFEVPEDPEDEEGRSAARLLSQQMFLQAGQTPVRWAADVEPGLEPVWRRLAGLANTRVVLGPDELDFIQREFERILAPFVSRDEADWPADGRRVRLLRYVLPEQADLPTEAPVE
ncbi:metalloregulator ArsR/SmtB family transcription factor [Streptomyces tubbatahanensis]|uniref:Metalloregulator ArsR/SmtB family transcription factor n=1 Tax=Streptomyces tubbatahanensis TaxID=2923272 RepID=A0ABY3XL00_9ACTN|nr:metalloregulator ArsR/SmtB family transcription factor [Streptomyces tubbatahanensis]UNS95092.1 metalloregulator ArsR/SmtB family transcription factor [Streptomyces tubbatahanensis]